MIYELECDCGAHSDHIMMMDEMEKWVKCPECGADICRRHHRVYTPPMIQGDTVSGGCNYDYYDPNLECHIRSKKHREDEMKRQGLREYSPDPVMKKHRDEVRHIRNNTEPGDAAAAAAIRKEHKAADTKRKQAAIDRVFSRVPDA